MSKTGSGTIIFYYKRTEHEDDDPNTLWVKVEPDELSYPIYGYWNDIPTGEGPPE